MEKLLWLFVVVLFYGVFAFTFGIKPAEAVYDPLSVSNNKIGVHILFTDELSKAKELVNSSGGDWGYVTIPIQTGDKDLIKWQEFMTEAGKLHLIPILRLASEGDYFKKETWKKPTEEDVLDFANFLSSLEWPVKNRYIIVFNEVNRADEWEGEANPEAYANLLSYAVEVFKSRSQDYFIISSGMDNAAITIDGSYSQYDYFNLMDESVPGIFNQIDGLSSHSYPNPAFSQPPSVKTPRSISSFLFEKQTIGRLSKKALPVFITETGWDQFAVGEAKSAEYFRIAMENIWNDPGIVALTPFLLKAGPGPFEKFSLIKGNGDKSEVFKVIESFGKTKGTPHLNSVEKPVSPEIINSNLPVKDFSGNGDDNFGKNMKHFIKWMILPL